MAQYKIYGTNQAYSGRVVQIGNKFFTTTGNVLEGNSKELVLVTPQTGNSGENLVSLNVSSPQSSPSPNDNPIVSTFFAPNTPRYYKPNGSLVAVGAPLHQHQDGTVMTEHSMGPFPDPNRESVIVTTTPPQSTITTQNGNGRGGTGGTGGNGRGGNGNTNQGGGGMGGY